MGADGSKSRMGRAIVARLALCLAAGTLLGFVLLPDDIPSIAFGLCLGVIVSLAFPSSLTGRHS